MAIRAGASALGLVSEMPSGPGIISEETIRSIAEGVPPSIATFLLTSRQTVEEIIVQQHFCRTNTLQLCDRLVKGTYSDLKNALPGIKIVQVIHVSGKESVQEAQQVAPDVHALLLDSGNPNLPIKELGGTGRIHNWEWSRCICDSVTVPVFLAGGLNACNIRDAIGQVRPFGVDVCSGVRTAGRLDESKLVKFIAATHFR
jgi:phosphoribosylanthranilate isomerase